MMQDRATFFLVEPSLESHAREQNGIRKWSFRMYKCLNGDCQHKFRRAKNYLRINKIRTKHILDTVTVSKLIGRLGDTLLILDF